MERKDRGFYILRCMSESLGERVRRARERAGMSQAELAKAIGIKQPSVHALETGTGERSKHVLAIASALGVGVDWLAHGEGKLEDAPAPNQRAAPFGEARFAPRELTKDLPVYGSAACGKDGLFDFNTGDVVDTVRRPPRLVGVRDAYALYLSGQSMSPWKEDGQLVFVHPGMPVRVGDYAVVELHPKKPEHDPRAAAFIKRVSKLSSEEVTLLQYNPKKEIKLKRKAIRHLHRVLSPEELLGV